MASDRSVPPRETRAELKLNPIVSNLDLSFASKRWPFLAISNKWGVKCLSEEEIFEKAEIRATTDCCGTSAINNEPKNKIEIILFTSSYSGFVFFYKDKIE